jgi:hypothetical protein
MNISKNQTTINEPLLSQRGRGRPRKHERNDNEPIKYYVKKGTKPTGRPKLTELSNLTQEERIKHNRQLERNYMLRRGKFVVKISYYEKRYNDILPQELINLPQTTDEEIIMKFNKMYDLVNQTRKINLLKTAKLSNIINSSSESDMNGESD